jgi:hypothetical protein
MGRFLIGLFVIGPLGSLGGCVVPRPGPDAIVEFRAGFETPEGAFKSLRTAFQGEMLDWEYDCFSQGFLTRNQLSRQAYRAFRPELMARVPHLRWGLYKAVVEQTEVLDERTVVLHARIRVPLVADRRLVVRVVHEQFYELTLQDGSIWSTAEDFDLFGGRSPSILLDPKQGPNGRVWLGVNLDLPLTPEQLEAGFMRITAAREWKIDSIAAAEPEG